MGVALQRYGTMKPTIPAKLIGETLCLVLLLSWFCGCDPRESLQRAMEVGDAKAIDGILKSNPSQANKPFRFGDMTPLFYASMCRNPKVAIDLLMANGADINARSGGFNLTPLQQAVWSGNVDAAKALLAHKPDVNAVNPDKQTAMHYALSVYMNAVFSGTTNNVGKEIIELLLTNGANVNLGTPILTAASHYAKNTGVMEFLLSKGANPNLQDSEGGTPLHYAVLLGKQDLVEIILRYHPDLRLKQGYYGTPLATAVDAGHLDVALLGSSGMFW